MVRDSVQERRLRATQTIVSHMSFCWRNPSVVALEVAWRWLFGVPFLLVVWAQAQQVLMRIPPESAGLDRLNFQNPWVSSVLLADAAALYAPSVAEVLRWLLPVSVVVWAIVSGLGRTLILWRIDALDSPRTDAQSFSFARKLPGVILLQGLWMVALVACFWVWYLGVSWAAATHITSATEPDLVGYLCWVIFLSLGLFTLWAMVNWTLAIAPILLVQDRKLSAFAALRQSFRLGKEFSGKLVEVNLVMSIVKIALIVLAMVFCAAPLPFSDQFGQDFMHLLYVMIAILYLVASDYFHVVRVKSFVEFWRFYQPL